MNRLLLPVSLDRFANPISSLLREVAVRNPQWDISSASSPDGAVAEEVVSNLWSLPHLHRCSVLNLACKKYDISHVASATWRNLFLLQLAKIRSGGKMKIIFTANSEPFEGNACMKQSELLVLGADILVAVSAVVDDSCYRRWGRRADYVIPNGADADFFDPAADFEVFRKEGRPYFAYVGAVCERKRVDLVIEMARCVPEADFIIAGSMPFPAYAAFCRKRAEGLANLLFVGQMDRYKLRSFLAGARGFVFPSEIEGLPLAVVEALMVGIPVLAQPKTCMPEMITDGENGYLLDGADIGHWQEKLRELIADVRNQPGTSWRAAIRANAKNRYSWDVVAGKYEEVYRNLLSD